MALSLWPWALGLQPGIPALTSPRARPRSALLMVDAAQLVEENERLIRFATRLKGVGEEGLKARLQEARVQEAKLEARLQEVTLARRALEEEEEEEEEEAGSPQPLARGEPSALRLGPDVAEPAAALKRLQRLQRLQDICERVQRLEHSLLHQGSAITLSAAAAAAAATAVAASASAASAASAAATATTAIAAAEVTSASR
jgi:hypothetical protein